MYMYSHFSNYDVAYVYMYSTDHKQLNARSRLTREGGARAHERSM